jgi:hypothetical protein
MEAQFCALRRPQAAFPAQVSPLYALFVPHGSDSELDADLARHVMTLRAYTMWSRCWYRHPAEAENAGRMIDLMQLALTCRHAYDNIKVKKLRRWLKVYAEQVASDLLHVFYYGKAVSELVSPFTNEYGAKTDEAKMVVSKTKAAVLAAFLGRPNVAALVRPPGLQLNATAIHLLYLRSPRSKDLDATHFLTNPLFWPLHPTPAVRPPKHLQYYWWLNATIQFNVPDMGPLYLKASRSQTGLRLMTRFNYYIFKYCDPTARPFLEMLEDVKKRALKDKKLRHALIEEAVKAAC